MFGNDGLYAETKIGLETLFHKWRSEGWSSTFSVVRCCESLFVVPFLFVESFSVLKVCRGFCMGRARNESLSVSTV